MIRKKWIDGEAKGYLVTPILPGRWHEGRGNDPLRIRQVKGMGRLPLDTILDGVFESLAR